VGTRIAILRKEAAQEGLNAPPEVLEFIPSKISASIHSSQGTAGFHRRRP